MEKNTEAYAEQKYQTLESYLVCEENPVCSYEPLSRLTGHERYIVLKTKHRKLNLFYTWGFILNEIYGRKWF